VVAVTTNRRDRIRNEIILEIVLEGRKLSCYYTEPFTKYTLIWRQLVGSWPVPQLMYLFSSASSYVLNKERFYVYFTPERMYTYYMVYSSTVDNCHKQHLPTDTFTNHEISHEWRNDHRKTQWPWNPNRAL